MASVRLLVLLLWALPGAAQPSREQAHQLFDQGRELFHQHRWDDARAKFEAAYELVPTPLLLYNIGRCHEEAGRAAPAVNAYEKYLAAVPDAPDRAEVSATIERLRRVMAATAPPPPPAKKPLHKRAWFWVALTGSAAAVATAVALSVTLTRDRDPSPSLGTVTGP